MVRVIGSYRKTNYAYTMREGTQEHPALNMETTSLLLPSLTCPKCRSEIAEARVEGKPPPATSFKTCLRQCPACGDVGASNTANPRRCVAPVSFVRTLRAPTVKRLRKGPRAIRIYGPSQAHGCAPTGDVLASTREHSHRTQFARYYSMICRSIARRQVSWMQCSALGNSP